MRFLCQLNSYGDLKSTYTNVEPSAGMAIYFQFLSFWCDGSLYIWPGPEPGHNKGSAIRWLPGGDQRIALLKWQKLVANPPTCSL